MTAATLLRELASTASMNGHVLGRTIGDIVDARVKLAQVAPALADALEAAEKYVDLGLGYDPALQPLADALAVVAAQLQGEQT